MVNKGGDRSPMGKDDLISAFSAREKKAKRYLILSAIICVIFLLAAIVVKLVVSTTKYPISPMEELVFSGMFWVVILVFVGMAEVSYRCPRCNGRPFSILGKGLTYSYGVQQELSKEFAEGKCQHCRALLKKPAKFSRQRRKW